jgi:L-ascorbate metabolism protein UlaG (beta-lactamase superfamily)
MHISWLGSTSIKIQTKPQATDVVVVIDPYKPDSGTFPRSLTPDIALFTNSEEGSVTLSGTPFTLSHPGEIETKDVLVTATQGHAAETTMLRIDSEHITVGHLGRTNKQLTSAQEEVLSGVDVLCICVGGGDMYDAEQALKIVNTLEPRIVIPIGFKSDNDPKADDLKHFLKQMGTKEATPEKKVIIKHKDLPKEETVVMVLCKE